MKKDWSTPLDESLIGARDCLILIRSADEARWLESIFDCIGIIGENSDVLDAWYRYDGNIAYRISAGGYNWGFSRPGFYDAESIYDDYLRFTFAPCVKLDDIDVPDSGMGLFE